MATNLPTLPQLPTIPGIPTGAGDNTLPSWVDIGRIASDMAGIDTSKNLGVTSAEQSVFSTVTTNAQKLIFGIDLEDIVCVILGLALVIVGALAFRDNSDIIQTAGKLARNGAQLAA